MHVVSVNVGLPRPARYGGRSYETAIFKTPVAGPVRVRRLNLDGDAQGNPKTHGGPDMAVYAFPAAHYPFWEREMATGPLPMGAFGENLTLADGAQGGASAGGSLNESEVCIGDVFTVGTARLQVTEPRTPCHKLAMKFDDPDLPRRFAERGTVGYYFRVLDEGIVKAGAPVILESRDPAGVTVAEVLALWADKGAGVAALRRVLNVPALSATWRGRFEKRLDARESGHLEWQREKLTWS